MPCCNTGRKCRLMLMFGMTTAFFLVEIIVGYVTNSMALVADSFHMLSDVISLVIAFLSIKMSPKKWSKNTFGWARAEVLGALVNAVFLVALCFSILVESLKRFYKPEVIDEPELILYVGISGLIVNLIGLFLFREHGHSHTRGHHHSLPTVEEVVLEVMEDDINDNHNRFHLGNSVNTPKAASKKRDAAGHLNIRGVYLHILADALGSIVVIISSLIIWLTTWEHRYYVDPALSLVMVCLIMKSTSPLLVDSALILLQTVPTHIQIDSLQKKLLQEIDGVLAVHEFHVWQLAGERIIASAHIRCKNLADYMQIAERVKEFFHNEGIHSTTIQPEFVEVEGQRDEKDCVLDCPSRTNCVAQTCCGPHKESNGQDSPRLNANGDGDAANAVLRQRVPTISNMYVATTTQQPMSDIPGIEAESRHCDMAKRTDVLAEKV
ncbi:proton-coupled zinc antiporter SLC30A1-like [Ornithodoros turicata]|uniref:Putative zn2+ transporter znt1 n=1 Tax=Ornithodoros turicata TaxID=34597 RepID=A0A2R5LL21_9ACAR